jgi:glutamate synthase domain-containing protein 3
MVELEPITAEDDAWSCSTTRAATWRPRLVDVSHDMTRFDAIRLKQLIKHLHYTNSDVARRILDDWANHAAEVRQGHAGGLPQRAGTDAGPAEPPARASPSRPSKQAGGRNNG